MAAKSSLKKRELLLQTAFKIRTGDPSLYLMTHISTHLRHFFQLLKRLSTRKADYQDDGRAHGRKLPSAHEWVDELQL